MLMKRVLLRPVTSAMARPEAELISPMMQAAPSRSTSRCALVEAVAGLTLSSLISSSWRSSTPPAALISSTASVMPMTAYSPSGPRTP